MKTHVIHIVRQHSKPRLYQSGSHVIGLDDSKEEIGPKHSVKLTLDALYGKYTTIVIMNNYLMQKKKKKKKKKNTFSLFGKIMVNLRLITLLILKINTQVQTLTLDNVKFKHSYNYTNDIWSYKLTNNSKRWKLYDDYIQRKHKHRDINRDGDKNDDPQNDGNYDTDEIDHGINDS